MEILIRVKNFFYYRIFHLGQRKRDYVTQNYFERAGNEKYKEEIEEIIGEMLDNNCNTLKLKINEPIAEENKNST